MKIAAVLLSWILFGYGLGAQANDLKGPLLKQVMQLFREGHTPKHEELRLHGFWSQCLSIAATAVGFTSKNPERYFITLKPYGSFIEFKTSFDPNKDVFAYAPTRNSKSELFFAYGFYGRDGLSHSLRKTIRISEKQDLIVELTGTTEMPEMAFQYPYPAIAFPEQRAWWYLFCPANPS